MVTSVLLTAGLLALPMSRITSVEITDHSVTVEYRYESGLCCDYLTGDSPVCEPPRVWREIYKVQNGKLVLVRRVEAKIIPPRPQRIEWPSDCPGGTNGNP